MLIARPGRMGPLNLRNRIIMGPMGTNYGTTDGLSTERAKGGAALIITEAMVITEGARNHTNSMCLFHDRYIPGLAGIVDAIHAGGALAVGQINHRGALLKRSVLGMEPVTASDWHNPNTGEPARAMTVAEIEAIQRAYLDSARRLYRAGYDAVELHAANGYPTATSCRKSSARARRTCWRATAIRSAIFCRRCATGGCWRRRSTCVCLRGVAIEGYVIDDNVDSVHGEPVEP